MRPFHLKPRMSGSLLLAGVEAAIAYGQALIQGEDEARVRAPVGLVPERPDRHCRPRRRKDPSACLRLLLRLERTITPLSAGEMASCEVVEAIGAEFGITQAAVSQHLKVLRESGFARVRASAQRRLYSVDAAGLQAVDAWIGQFRNLWEPKLDALAMEVARGKRERRRAPIATRSGKRA